MQRTIIVISDDILKAQCTTLSNLEVKSIQTKIPIQKPLKTTIIDSTIEYSRILFDIFPSEVGVSLIIGDHKPQIVNDWNEEQQSFIYMGKQLGQLENYLMDELEPEKFCEYLINHMFKNEENTQETHKKYNIIYFLYSPFEDIHRYESEKILPLLQKFVNRLQEFYLNSKNTQSLTFYFDIVIPIVNANQNILNNFEGKTFINKPYNFHSSDTRISLKMRTSYVLIESIGEFLLELGKERHNFLKITVSGIPMRETNTQTNTQYDVVLACRGYFIDICQDKFTKLDNINLQWMRSDSKSTVDQLFTTKSVHHISPVHPYTQPTICLMKHLGAGKPVTLKLETEYNKKHRYERTHLILQHGPDIYLHVLNLNRAWEPWLTIPRQSEPKVRYRNTEFQDIISKHMIYPPPDDDETMFEEKQKKIKTATMEHRQFRYSVPKSIERQSRLFPLCQDEKSVIFNSEASPTLREFVSPVLDIALKAKLTDKDRKQARKLLTKLYQSAQKNDAKLIPELANDHTKRYETYRKVWSELRMFIITLAHNSLLSIMDKMWPQFFFDNTSDQQGGKETRRNRRLVEVQRDRHGNVIYPIPLGGITIWNLGKVVYDRPAYHTDKYIWPVGYKSTRMYTSFVNIDKRCLYTSEIRDGGQNPLFVLTCEDKKDEPIIASSATAAWTVVVKRVNDLKTSDTGKRVFTNVSGPEYFGLAHPTVMKLISELPNAEKCVRPNCQHQPSRQPNKEYKDESESEQSGDEEEKTEKQENQLQLTPKEMRDQRINRQKEIINNQLENMEWNENTSFLDYMSTKNAISSIAIEFDGRSAGESGLYKQSDTKKRKIDEITNGTSDENPQKIQKQLPGLSAT